MVRTKQKTRPLRTWLFSTAPSGLRRFSPERAVENSQGREPLATRPLATRPSLFKQYTLYQSDWKTTDQGQRTNEHARKCGNHRQRPGRVGRGALRGTSGDQTAALPMG